MFTPFLMALAWAAPIDDLTQAADANISVVERESAFARVVAAGSTEIQYLLDIVSDTNQPTRLRWVAIRALGQIKGPTAQTVLLSTLNDPEPAIRTAAVSALGDYGNAQNVKVIGKFLKDPAVIVRVAAAESLGKLNNPSAVELLSAALDDESNTYRGSSLWVRSHFVLALGNVGSNAAYPTLLRCLSDGDERVVQSAVHALEMIAGFSLGDGRTPEQEIEAWSRWIQNQIQ